MRFSRLLFVTVVSACGGSSTPPKATSDAPVASAEGKPAARASAPAEAEDESVVRRPRHPEVVAYAAMKPLVSSIRPGRSFWLALHLTIHPGYRVSWTYPGDVGREIRVTFSGPDGFAIGRVVYPAPQRFVLGDHLAFGWEHETAAFVEVTPPRRLTGADAYRFDVKADWLSCNTECLRETTHAYLELTASPSGGARVDDEALTALQARVPKAFSAEKDASHEWADGPRVPRVSLAVEGVRLSEFIPATESARKAVTAQVLEDGAALALEYEDPPGPPPHTTYGVLLGMRGEEYASYEVEIPWIDVEHSDRTQ